MRRRCATNSRRAESSPHYGAWLDALLKKSAKTYVVPLDIAEVYVRLGDRDNAFAWLRKAIADRSPGVL